MAKKKKTEDDEILKNADLGEELFIELANKANEYIPGSGHVYNDDDIDADLTSFVSTGSKILDTVISNRKDRGGFPVGRISEVIGWESSGKSLIAAHACKDTQLQGGIPVYYDIEKALSLQFVRNLGVDIPHMVYNKRLVTIENVLEQMTNDIQLIIEKQLAHKAKNRRLITIIIDSLAAVSAQDTVEADIGKRQYANVARILSQELPKVIDVLDDANVAMIVLNQLREKPGVVYGDKFYSPGGNAMKFYASLRILLTKGQQIKVNKDKPNEQVVGFNTTAITKKNKISSPLRKANFDIYFNRGVDDNSGYLNILKQTGVVNVKNKQTFELIDIKTGDTIDSCKSTQWPSLVSQHKDYIIQQVQDALILDLSNPNLIETREDISDGDSLSPDIDSFDTNRGETDFDIDG